MWGDLSQLVAWGRHYSRAPIAEAILELRVVLPDHVTLDDLASLMKDDPDYPTSNPQIAVQGQFEIIRDDVISSASGRIVGHAWPRQDQRRVVQAHLDRFVFSWLPPYDRWDVFLEEAESMWSRFRSVAQPQQVVGVGVRFVNKIDIHSSAVEIKDYLRTSVDVSPYLPQFISGLFMQIDVPLQRHQAMATITTMLTESPEEGQTSLVLDIDTRRQVAMSLDDKSFDADLRASLAVLRDAKNYVFEACITDATRGLIS